MINRLLFLFTGKEIILYNKHRNTTPITEAEENRKKYFFIQYLFIWKFTYFFGRKSRCRYKVMSLILSLISPKYIIDVNWTDRMHLLFYIFSKKSSHSNFIVVQHGVWSAGYLSIEKFTKCNIMLCWGAYFKNEILRINKGGDAKVIAFGNPFYNKLDRNKFFYSKERPQKILFATSRLRYKRFETAIEFLQKMVQLGFDVSVKEHSLQSEYKAINGFNKVEEDFYSILEQNKFDIIITDVSSALLDSIFFKNKTLFFSPPGEFFFYTENVYSKFMVNIAEVYKKIDTKEEYISLVDIDAQEKLFDYLITIGNNDLTCLSSAGNKAEQFTHG